MLTTRDNPAVWFVPQAISALTLLYPKCLCCCLLLCVAANSLKMWAELAKRQQTPDFSQNSSVATSDSTTVSAPSFIRFASFGFSAKALLEVTRSTVSPEHAAEHTCLHPHSHCSGLPVPCLPVLLHHRLIPLLHIATSHVLCHALPQSVMPVRTVRHADCSQDTPRFVLFPFCQLPVLFLSCCIALLCFPLISSLLCLALFCPHQPQSLPLSPRTLRSTPQTCMRHFAVLAGSAAGPIAARSTALAATTRAHSPHRDKCSLRCRHCLSEMHRLLPLPASRLRKVTIGVSRCMKCMPYLAIAAAAIPLRSHDAINALPLSECCLS